VVERIFLVRHAETLVNQKKVLRGSETRHDVLSERGQAQARACAAAFAALNLADPRVYASTYTRAQQTARAIADALRVEPTVVEGLQEMDIGAWFGRPYGDLDTHVHELLGQDGSVGFPAGESCAEVAGRTRAALDLVLSRGGTPIVVSHGLAIQTLLCDLLGENVAEAWQDRRYLHQNTGVTELIRRGGQWEPARIGCVRHLPRD